MWGLRGERRLSRFADIGHRVDRGDDLEPPQPGKRRPRVLAGAGEEERREDERESRLVRVRRTNVPSSKPKPAPSQGTEERPAERRASGRPTPGDGTEDNDPDRDHDRDSDQERMSREDHFFGGDETSGHRCQQPVLDLTVQPNSATSGKASVCMLVITAVSASKPGNSRSSIAVLRVAEATEHLAEDEEQKQRLKDDLRHEGGQLLPGDMQVSMQLSHEGIPGA